MHIRPYQASDAPATLALFLAAVTQTAAQDYTSEQVKAWARPQERNVHEWDVARQARNTFVAVSDGQAVGFSDVSATGYIDMMFVAPHFSRQGIAKELLLHLEQVARAQGVTKLQANVSITARPFFENHGFVVVAEQHPSIDGVQLVNYLMTKPLLV